MIKLRFELGYWVILMNLLLTIKDEIFRTCTNQYHQFLVRCRGFEYIKIFKRLITWHFVKQVFFCRDTNAAL